MIRSAYFLSLLLLSFAGQGQSGFQVQPSKLYFNEQNGALTPARIFVKNPSQVRMVVRASCADWRRDSVGNKQYFPPGELPTSCCPYLLVQPETVELQPGEEKEMIVTLQPTQSPATDLRHAMLTQANEHELAAAQKVTASVIFRIQLGVHLYHIPATAKNRSLVIDTLLLPRAEKTPADADRQVRIRVANSGDLNAESTLRVELTNLQTAQETKLEPIGINTLPNDRIWVNAGIKEKLPKGRYLIVAILDSGPDIPLQVAELEADLL